MIMKKQLNLSDEESLKRPLIDLINEAYSKIKRDLPYDTVQDFIKDDKKTTEFIQSILQDKEFETPDKKSKIYALAETRARHSAITFLIGLVLFQYGNLGSLILNSSYLKKADGHNTVIHLWMLTALYHDYGYFLSDIQGENIDCKAKVKYDLLEDSYPDNRLKALRQFSTYHKDVFAYTYEEIEEYEKCSRKWRKQWKDENEKVDHGILGGIRIFDRLIKRIINRGLPVKENELLVIKASCLTIAQHNIYKSDSIQRDKKYGVSLKKLHSTSTFVIDSSTPLLFLLSLVDTFECVKRLSKGENKAQSLQTITVLSCINISVSQDELIIDFSELDKRVQEKENEELKKNYRNYKKNLLELKNWTSFTANEFGDGIIKVTINSLEHYRRQAALKNINTEPTCV